MTRRIRLGRAAWLAAAATCFLAAPVLRAQPQAPPQEGRGGQQAAPTGPMAPEKYKNIQVLTDVPAAQLDITMRYFVAATGIQCASCHMTDRATGVTDFAADSNGKKTAREMINLVKTVNAGEFGAKINCGTCHQGHNQPAGLRPATMMTSDEILQYNTQQVMLAMRAMNPPPANRGGGPGGDRGGAPPQGQAGRQAGPGGPGGGRGQQPAGPPVADILKKYTDALGSAAATLQSRVMTGTLTTRAAQAMPFTITQKGHMYLETLAEPAPRTIGFDGTAGWEKVGDKTSTLEGFPLESALRGADLDLAAELNAKAATLQSGRPSQMTLTPGAAPIAVDTLQTTSGQTTERFYFDASTGLLVRRLTQTRTPLNGALTETTDYSNYRAEGGVMMPHKITRTNWNALDTLTVSRVTLNGPVDDAGFHKPR